MIPPALVKPPAMEGTGFLGQAAENVYRLEADDMYLVGTAEVPLAAYHSDEILDAATLPAPLRRLLALLPARGRLGRQGHPRHLPRALVRQGRDVLLLRARRTPSREHARLLAWEREFLDSLEIPYRVIDVASGDLGASAARKFDIEAWIPTQGDYREVTSTSNCTEFQARRLRVRMRDEDGVRPLATLNGTLVAITRVDRRDAREPPAGRRLGARAGRPAPVPRRPRVPDADRLTGARFTAICPRICRVLNGSVVSSPQDRGQKHGMIRRSRGCDVHGVRRTRWTTA